MLGFQQERGDALPGQFRRLLEAIQNVLVSQGHLCLERVNQLNLRSGKLDELLPIEGKGLVHGSVNEQVLCVSFHAARRDKTDASGLRGELDQA